MTAKTLILCCNWRCCIDKARAAGIPLAHVIYVHGPESIRHLGHGTRGMARKIAPCFENRKNAEAIRDALYVADMCTAPADQIPDSAPTRC